MYSTLSKDKLKTTAAKPQTTGADRSRQSADSATVNLSRIISGDKVQPKLKVGPANDRYELEADAVAERILSTEPVAAPVPIPYPNKADSGKASSAASPVKMEKKLVVQKAEEEEAQPKLLQRQSEEEEEMVQPQRADGLAVQASPDFSAQVNGLRGGGQPLPKSERSFFEPRFGVDFSAVRVHNNVQAGRLAGSINARAFAVGADVVFGRGQYAPGTTAGRRLMAHELTHVVQQRGNKPGVKSHPLPGISRVAATSRVQRQARGSGVKYVDRLIGRSGAAQRAKLAKMLTLTLQAIALAGQVKVAIIAREKQLGRQLHKLILAQVDLHMAKSIVNAFPHAGGRNSELMGGPEPQGQQPRQSNILEQKFSSPGRSE